MLEDNAIRALVLGVSVFILIITLTSILLYYNSAVQVARVSSDARMNIVSLYEKSIDELNDMIVSGIEVRNIVRFKYEKYDKLNLKIVDSAGISSFDKELSKDDAGNIKDTEVNQIRAEKEYKLNLTENLNLRTLDFIICEQ